MRPNERTEIQCTAITVEFAAAESGRFQMRQARPKLFKRCSSGSLGRPVHGTIWTKQILTSVVPLVFDRESCRHCYRRLSYLTLLQVHQLRFSALICSQVPRLTSSRVGASRIRATGNVAEAGGSRAWGGGCSNFGPWNQTSLREVSLGK